MFELEIITSQTDVIFQISLSVNELKIAIDKMPKIGILPSYAVAELVGGRLAGAMPPPNDMMFFKYPLNSA